MSARVLNISRNIWRQTGKSRFLPRHSSILWHRKDGVSYESRHHFSILILFLGKVMLFPMGNSSNISSQNHPLLQVLMLSYKTQICKECKENPVLIATDCEDQRSQKSHIRALLIYSVFKGPSPLLPLLSAIPPPMHFFCLCLVIFQMHFMDHPTPTTHTQPSFCLHGPLWFLIVYKSHMYVCFLHLPCA